jgi:hypothetical protein
LRREGEFATRKDAWKYGKDVMWGEFAGVVPPNGIRRENCFYMVRGDFEYVIGQLVGIAVFMPPDDVLYTSLQQDGPHLQEETLRAIYGTFRDRKANIYAGEIKYIGEYHIEYDLDSFEGCFGAIVFLLDSGQPESVTEADYGKAIAVHSGAHPDKHLKRNIGFLLK